MRPLLTFFLAAFLLPHTCLIAGTVDAAGVSTDPARFEGHKAEFKIDLAGAKNLAAIVELPDQSLAIMIQPSGSETSRLLSPEEFAQLYYSQKTSRDWISALFNITSPAGIAWVALGLGGQLLFTGRMLIQWIASERSQKSVIPISFWWMSLIGATMLLVYFIWRRDIVGVLGQATGWMIYIRNLILIHKSRHRL